MMVSDVILGVLDDGPFSGGTYPIHPGQSLTFNVSWLNPRCLVYSPTGEIVDTPEGEAVILRCGEAHAELLDDCPRCSCGLPAPQANAPCERPAAAREHHGFTCR
ncbi:hypothetical protein [Candidatus Protofrankia californiensis]|uniref:hypothetical protein n=1 Tax=Candidatus Protofrankia californiensis TaxID=1839754 RepID=UPI0010415BC9|nr:hypothetical protein [Candidatus Protofrankia californiensis]